MIDFLVDITILTLDTSIYDYLYWSVKWLKNIEFDVEVVKWKIQVWNMSIYDLVNVYFTYWSTVNGRRRCFCDNDHDGAGCIRR